MATQALPKPSMAVGGMHDYVMTDMPLALKDFQLLWV